MPPLARIPAENSRQKISCSAPVLRQRAVQRGPVGARAHHPRDRDGQRDRRPAEQQPRASSSRTPTAAARSANAPASIAVYSARVRSRPRRTASVRLPARRSVSRSRTLLTTRIALASRPTGHRAHERLPRQRLHLHEVRAGHGDDPEEQEHEQLAEALVAVRPRTAGVEHARRGSTPRRPPAAPGRRPRPDRRRRQPPARTSRTSPSAPGAGGTSPPAVTRTGPSRSSVSAPRRASE